MRVLEIKESIFDSFRIFTTLKKTHTYTRLIQIQEASILMLKERASIEESISNNNESSESISGIIRVNSSNDSLK
jgi:hypothetical protein